MGTMFCPSCGVAECHYMETGRPAPHVSAMKTKNARCFSPF